MNPADDHEVLIRAVAHVMGRADDRNRAALLLDLGWDLRHHSLYSVGTAREILLAAADRMGFHLGTSAQIDQLATALHRQSRESFTRLSDFVDFTRRLEITDF